MRGCELKLKMFSRRAMSEKVKNCLIIGNYSSILRRFSIQLYDARRSISGCGCRHYSEERNISELSYVVPKKDEDVFKDETISPENFDYAPVTSSESKYHSLVLAEPNQPPNSKIVKVSVLGMPNSGKSTMINAILGRKILATSHKIDTTTENTRAISTIGDIQIVCQDTPGMMSRTKSNRLRSNMRRIGIPHESFSQADLGLVVADLTSLRVKDGFLQPEILMTMLKNRHVPSVLVLNKVDKYRNKRHLLPLIYILTAGRVGGVSYKPTKSKIMPMRIPKQVDSSLEEFEKLDLTDEENLKEWFGGNENRLLNKLRYCRGWPHFRDVFVISGKTGFATDELRSYILSNAKQGPWIYHSDVKTDASPKQVILDSIRASMLEHLPEEIPYSVRPRIVNWSQERDGVLMIDIEIVCGKKSHFTVVTRTAPKLARIAQEHLQDVFFVEAYVQISPVWFKNLNAIQ